METRVETIIRRARSGDDAALRDILRGTIASTWLPVITPEAARAYHDRDLAVDYVAERGSHFWVAERNGEVVGLVDWQDDFIDALHVHPRHARKGIGAALMDKAEREIAISGHAEARLETDTFNLASRAFYAARGYREIEQYPDTEWNSGLTTLLLAKQLR